MTFLFATKKLPTEVHDELYKSALLFLALAIEIRLRIYHYALADAVIFNFSRLHA
jgi:hypothetical protein